MREIARDDVGGVCASSFDDHVHARRPARHQSWHALHSQIFRASVCWYTAKLHHETGARGAPDASNQPVALSKWFYVQTTTTARLCPVDYSKAAASAWGKLGASSDRQWLQLLGSPDNFSANPSVQKRNVCLSNDVAGLFIFYRTNGRP